MKEGQIPKEAETIAARRSARLADKIKKAREDFKTKKSWWSNGLFEFLSLALVFSLNFYLVWPFFGTPAPDTAYSGPVIPLLAYLVRNFDIPQAYAIQIINIAFFLAFPFTFYLLVKKLSNRKLVALLAAVLASLPFYPFAKLRLENSLFGIESPHMAGLTLIPVAIYGLLSFIHQGGPRNLIIAAFSSALVALTSPFSFFTYSILAFITAFSEVLLGRGRLKMARLLAVFLFAGGLASFWYNPGFFLWMIVSPMGEDIRQTIAKLIPVSFFALPVLGAFGYLLFDRKPNLQPVFLASFYTIAFAMIVMVGGGFFPSHPSRYAPELGLSLAFLLAISLVKFSDYIRLGQLFNFSPPARLFLSQGIILLVFLAGILVIIKGRQGLMVGEEEVLGAWTGIERGEIWMAKEKFGGIWALLGYSITGLSFSGLSLLASKERFASSRQGD